MMGRILGILGLFVGLVGVAQAAPQARGLKLGPPPAWVETFPLPSATDAAKDDGNGIDELLLDEQINPAEQATYFRSARRFVTAAGVERGSQLSFRWDPSYQTLTVHGVTLIRGAKRIDALRPGALRVLQREGGMEFNLFDGTLTAAVVLDDVRTGDTLEFAFTRTGYNPIFAGKYIDDLGMRSDVPFAELRFRLLWPQQRHLYRKAHGEIPIPRMTVTGDTLELVWEAHRVPALMIESDLPSWYDPSPWLQLSEFETWNDVARWAMPLYARGKPGKQVQALARRFEAEGKNGRERAVAALRFVQEEIRYLGFEMGTGSHRPNPPELVLSRRFGDCKDKALLLVALLEELGLKAWPALVHTQFAQDLDHWHPSPLAFNHVIVCTDVMGVEFWLDPTETRQGGPLDIAATPPFRRALLVDETTAGLSEISVPRQSVTEIHENWSVPSLKEPASFVVTTTFRGPAANQARARYLNRRHEEMDKSALEFYTERYPGVSTAKPLTVDDNVVENVFTTTETYTVANFFAAKGDGRGLTASLYPQEVRDTLPDPGSRKRTMPLGLNYPMSLIHETVIELPDDWPVTPKTTRVDTPYFRYHEAALALGHKVKFLYSWETLADSIPAEKVPEALAQIKTISDSLGWELTHNGIVQSETKATGLANLNVSLAAITVLFAGVCAGAAVKAARWRPPATVLASPEAPQLNGIRGWLVLLAIGLVFRPLFILNNIVTNFGTSFQADAWSTLTTPGGVSFHPLWAPLIVSELLWNVFDLFFSMLLIFLFFRHRRSFPWLMIGMLVLAVLAQIADASAAPYLPTVSEPEARAGRLLAARAVVQGLIWIPYLLRSRRVRATFIR
jgi:transglutaminase-like putative cysteine protease